MLKQIITRHSALSKVRLTIFLVFVGIISSSTSWANDFAPPCDTIVLVTGEVFNIHIQTENNTGIIYTLCNETDEKTLKWNEIEDIRRWVKPKKTIKNQKTNLDSTKEAHLSDQQKEDHQQLILNHKKAVENQRKINQYQSALLKQQKEVLQFEKAQHIKWRFGMNFGAAIYTNLNNIDQRFRMQGFNTDYESSNLIDLYPYDHIPTARFFMGFTAERRLKENTFVGLKISHFRQKILAQNHLYTDGCNGNWLFYSCHEVYHTVESYLSNFLISPKIEFTVPKHNVSVYGGISANFIKDSRFRQVNVRNGLFVGFGLLHYVKNDPKRQGYVRLFCEYHYQGNYKFRGEYYETTDEGNGQVYQSQFDGLNFSLNHLQIGIELGLATKNKNK